MLGCRGHGSPIPDPLRRRALASVADMAAAAGDGVRADRSLHHPAQAHVGGCVRGWGDLRGAGGGFFAIASSLWPRQRFSSLTRDGDSLVVRAMAANRRLAAADIERAKVVRLSAVFGRPGRRTLLPRPVDQWLATEAISIRLRDGVDTRALRRIAGVRCVIDDLLVVPIADADGLLAELLEHA